MDHQEMPLPTHKYRRSSLFDNGNEEQDKTVNVNFPEEKSEVYYPLEYVDKVKTEIEDWEMHISKTMEERQQFKSKRMELQNSTVDKNLLSTEQLNFLESLNFDHYMNRVENFCTRAEILTHQTQYKEESETKMVQSKIEKEIFKEKEA